MRICIVGAGFTGAVIGRELAEAGHEVVVVDERDHVAGNCHTERDGRTGILVHRYGPHIFHTDNEEVWRYIRRFGRMMPYVNRVKANCRGEVYSLPINLHTINQFFRKSFSPEEAERYVRSMCRSDIEEPENFEEQALKLVGEQLYQAFFHGYTCKQWGVEPKELPASILKRLPVRFTYDDNYFAHRFQGMPRNGYTEIVEKILDAPGMILRLDCRFEEMEDSFDHLIYTGPIDRYYRFSEGHLGYRTLDFERVDRTGDLQGTAVMNYCDREIPFTRIAEHKHFAPWEAEQFERTVCFREYSRACMPSDIPFYPIRLVGEKAMLAKYVERAMQDRNITFAGRLGTYSYLDMDVAIARALETARSLNDAFAQSVAPPVFVHSPL